MTNTDPEFKNLLITIEKRYGHKFHNYSMSSLTRRINNFMDNNHIDSYVNLEKKLIEDHHVFEMLLKNISIPVTEMFRDPNFYISFKKNIIPVLKSYPFIKIWCAGCATGEEAYSIAILLHQEKLLDRTTLYATDFNNDALEKAKQGIYPAEKMKKYISNYKKFSNDDDFSNYFITKYDAIKIKESIKNKITFANHNLVTDHVFGEMNVILCRNVMIYFNKTLSDQVFTLFTSSLLPGGFLCLGSKESLSYSSTAEKYECIDNPAKIYRLGLL